MRSVLLMLVAGLAAFSLACGSSPESTPAPVDVTGAVTFSTLEGGAWLIQADSGTLYRPLNLPESYKVEGTRVRARLVEHRDVGGYLPGIVADIVTIETAS